MKQNIITDKRLSNRYMTAPRITPIINTVGARKHKNEDNIKNNLYIKHNSIDGHLNESTIKAIEAKSLSRIGILVFNLDISKKEAKIIAYQDERNYYLTLTNEQRDIYVKRGSF